MSDELDDYLADQLGFERKTPRRAGLSQAIDVFLGPHLEQRTSIQEEAIEVIYDGADVLLISATASGKTEAALVPVAARLLSESGRVALYIAPTRALLNDLHRRLEAPLHQLGLEARVRHGDRRLPAKTSTIRVLFTTPESLDVLLSKNMSLLRRVKYVIADEIHQIFGTPRGDQFAFLLQRLDHLVGAHIQRIALSATVGDPAEVSKWLSAQREPARVIEAPGGRSIIGTFRWLSHLSLLRDWVRRGEAEKVLCFVNSRRRCDDVYLSLRDAEPYQSFVHYSTLTKQQREYVERGFRSAQMAVCVATSTLELGIDIGSIEEVVLVDAPNTVSSFLQRIGRGGRRGEFTPVTATPETSLDLLRFIAMVGLGRNGQIETAVVGQPYSVFIQQIFSILAGRRRLRIHPDDLGEQFAALSWLSADHIGAILDRLVEEDFLRRDPNSRVYEVGPGLEELTSRWQIFTNISGQSVGTPVFHSGRLLAYLPLRPSQIRHGNVILFAGRFWRIVAISDRGLTVNLVESVPDPVRPAWTSKGVFASSSVLGKGMRDLLVTQPDLSDDALDDECMRRVEALYSRAENLSEAANAVWYERLGDRHVYYTFAGAVENQVLRLAFEQSGRSCQPASRAEGIAVTSIESLDFDELPGAAEEVVAMITSQWRRLAGSINSGPFFEYLPPALKREETVSQIARSTVVQAVTAFRGAPVVPVDLQLLE